MASFFALKKLVSSGIPPRALRSIISSSATSASRFSYNTNAFRECDDDDGDDREFDFESLSARSFPPSFFPELFEPFEPFSPTRSLSMNQMGECPDFAGERGGLRPGWAAKVTEDALNLSIDMPGLGKEDVKVSLEQNTLVIKGKGGKEGGDEESARRYTSKIGLPENIFKTDQIKAEMKNGVLKLTLPKMKEDERTDVLHVKVE